MRVIFAMTGNPPLGWGQINKHLLVQQCRRTKLVPFDMPSQQCGNVCGQNGNTKFVFWFLTNISAQETCW